MSSFGDAVVFYDPKNPPLYALVPAHAAFKDPKVKVKVAPRPNLPVVNATLMRTKESVSGENLVAAFVARVHAAQAGSSSLYPSDPLTATQIDFFVAFADSLAQLTDRNLGALNIHLKDRTYLVGDSFTLADAAVWAALKKNVRWPSFQRKAEQFADAFRWFATADSAEETEPSRAALEKSVAPEPEKKKKNDTFKTGAERKAELASAQGGRFDINLKGAVKGQVVTRFPPEPSGYLHIGHAKAMLINYFIAKHYDGKMLLRFDDTNPDKEKQEFTDNILLDLKTLGVEFASISHTSDYFDTFLEYCERMIKEGNAYVDDTPVDQMRKERMDGIDSVRRNRSVEENLALWQEMVNGTEVGLASCVRAKIDMQAKNKTLRDPVIYRCNIETPHIRTGFKYKVYPTYDFICPIIDSLEGVTHTLRTTEYHDRNDQYYWFIKVLGLRKPEIEDYGRLSFQYTLMSKRKLKWFVETNRVDGWNDPRFPTVQGILRRGLTVDALREFIRRQGASKLNTCMEWDKIWALNKQMIDPSAFRYNAVGLADDDVSKAVLTLDNFSKVYDGKNTVEETVGVHPKDTENKLGTKVIVKSTRIFLEPDDAKSIADGEEITLMNWGNCIIHSVKQEGSNITLSGSLNLEGDFRKTKKKISWVGASDDTVPINMVEYDHLITKKQLKPDDDFDSVIRECSKYETPLVGESAMKDIKENQIIQIMRRGYFRCDKPYGGPDKPLVLFYVPDGKTKASSTVTRKVQP